MPQYFNVYCPICNTTKRRPGTSKNPPVYCSKKCYEQARTDKISKRIGEPLDAALIRLYVLERKSYREISKTLGINHRTVMRHLKKLDIKPRRGSEAIKTQWEGNEKRRQRQSERFNVMRKTQVGKNHHKWRGGRVGGRHEMLGWEKFAQSIRERDGLKCTRCGIINTEHKRKYKNYSLCVHHIVPYKLSKNNHSDNLKTLCIPCHLKTENEFTWLL